jgi:hypothetical protein
MNESRKVESSENEVGLPCDSAQARRYSVCKTEVEEPVGGLQPIVSVLSSLNHPDAYGRDRYSLATDFQGELFLSGSNLFILELRLQLTSSAGYVQETGPMVTAKLY